MHFNIAHLGSYRRRELWYPIRNRQILIASFLFMLFVWIGVRIAALQNPIYEAQAILLVKPTALNGNDATVMAASLRPEQMSRPQLTILGSEDIIRRAVRSVGEEKILPEPARASLWWGTRLSLADAAYLRAKEGLKVRMEPQTDLLRVSFRHTDPAVSVEFVNSVVTAFSLKYSLLYDNRGAAKFFRLQKTLNDQLVANASSKLIDFSVKNSVFIVADQRRLLLERRNNLAAAVAATNGLIMDRESRATAIPAQLAQMKPIGRLPQITGLTQGKSHLPAKGVETTPRDEITERLAKDPPLLLVRVYQDTVAELVKLRTELAGLRALAAQQVEQLTKVDEELVSLSHKETEFARLRTEVDRATRRAETVSKRAQEEELAQDLHEASFASVQVVQAATMPLKPIWPHVPILFAIGVVLSAAPFVLHYTIRLLLARPRPGVSSPASPLTYEAAE